MLACTMATRWRSCRPSPADEDQVFDKLQSVESKYEDLMGRMAAPAVQSDPSEYRTVAKSLSEIEPLVEKYREYKTVAAEIEQAQELA